MEEEVEVNSPITLLPNEIVTIILQYNDCLDIVSFGATCTRFWELVQSNEIIWKDKFRTILPAIMYKSVEKHCEGKWFASIKSFYDVKKQLFAELNEMSPKYHLQCYEINIEDVRHFFKIALSSNFNYFYVIFILQEIIRKGNYYIDNGRIEKPYRLTEMYYVKVVLRHLIHTFLIVKWVKLHKSHDLSPEIVVNFFLQWIDTTSLHLDVEINDKIEELAKKIECILAAQCLSRTTMPIREQCHNKDIRERNILRAICEVLYQQRHMAVTASSNLETLDIKKVLVTRCGNITVVGAIYHALTRRFGVRCEMVVFPNHFLLEWRDCENSSRPEVYTIDMHTGEPKPKRHCPFSHNNQFEPCSYIPDSLLEYIYSSYRTSMGAINNWNTQNAFLLADFLGINRSPTSPYRNFLPYLINQTHQHAMNINLDITYLKDCHVDLIRSLVYLNTPPTPHIRNFVIKRRVNPIRYAVGMICYHKKYDYVGIIRSWDICCNPKWMDHIEMESNLDYGMEQPFYYLIAADQSGRYVAEENLVNIARPNRLYHLEDAIAREFTHFDGFSYVPNEEKRAEYPDDEAIAAMYRTHSHYRR